MAKKKNNNKSRRRNGIKIPVAIVAGFMPMVIKTWEHTTQMGPSAGVRELGRITTGFDFWDGSWTWQYMKHGTFPLLAGMAVHWVASRVGLNRAIARSGIPFIRV